MKETKEEKALRYLMSGQVKVAYHHPALTKIEVTSDSGGDPYYVTREDGVWACDCPAQIPLCAHVLASKTIIPVEGYVVEESTGFDLDSLLDG